MLAVEEPPAGRARQVEAAPPASVEFHYVQSESFVALLGELEVSLVVSTYQANKLLVVRALPGGISTLVRTFERPMGIAVDARRIALGTRNQIWTFRNAPDIAPRIEPVGRHDACFLPRSCHVTGDIGVHEVAWGEVRSQESGVRGQVAARTTPLTPDPCLLSPELWLVSTRFSCLCTLHPDYSFVPRWRPPFITALAAEDRCHLNGLAVVDGQPRFVTAMGQTDSPGGWRESKNVGGCVLKLPDGEAVAEGLSMPHSPRWHDDRLWVLESGTGSLRLVDVPTGRCERIVELPGFARGLALCGPYAFIGLSKIRSTSAMDGVPLAARRNELKCGIAAVDLRSGRVAGLLEFQTAVEEIFDVQLLPGLRFPEVVGFQKDEVHNTFVVPPAVL
jgi:Domain of unknown function (DUF4915)